MGFIRFSIVRSAVFGLCFISSACVVGLSAYQATLFMDIASEKPYIIFALIVSVLSLFLSAFLGYQYTFHTHIFSIGLLAILWLALAATVTDQVGYASCESFDGQTRPTETGKAYDEVSWCRQMKAIMGFSWFGFALMMIAVVSWIRLQEEEELELGGGYYGGGYNGAFVGGAGVGGYGGGRFRRPRWGGFGRKGLFGGGLNTGFGGGIGSGIGGVGYTGAPPVVYQQPGYNVVVGQGGQVQQVPAGTGIIRTI